MTRIDDKNNPEVTGGGTTVRGGKHAIFGGVQWRPNRIPARHQYKFTRFSSEHARFRYKFCILVYCHTLIHAVKINENAVFGPNPGHFALPKSVSNGHESLSNDYYDAYIFVSGSKVNPYSVHGSVE